MDKATPPYKGFLWNKRERRKTANMDCRINIFACSYSQKGAEDIVATLHNFADIEPDPVRENAYLSSTFRE
jgi:hypothetical protein